MNGELNHPVLTAHLRMGLFVYVLMSGELMMERTDKNNKIRETLKATKERRRNMTCRVYEVKVDRSKMSKALREEVNLMFREAKWLRNAYIADMNNVTWKDKTVKVKVKDEFEDREITVLGSQIRQSVIQGVKDSLKALHATKEKGRKVGQLKFKSVCNCVDLKQFQVTYDIDTDRSRIRVQGIKNRFRVRGLQQIPENAEIANAKFIRKASGLYFHITCYVPKGKTFLLHRGVGIDFGIRDNLVFSDGSEPVNIRVPESKGTKLASAKLNKALKKNGGNKGKNHFKRKQDLRRSYEKTNNKKKDLANKTVHDIVNSYDFIAIQDELIRSWHKGLFGKQVQHSAMGVIKRKLKDSSNVHVVEAEFPSTQICPVCGRLTKHPLAERSYNCQYCGYHHDSRDVKAAGSILDEAMRKYSLSGRESSESCVGQVLCSEADKNLLWNKIPPMGVSP